MTNPYDKIQAVEDALSKDIGERRFIPYIQLHEFEALVFADPEKLNSEYLERNQEIGRLVEISSRENPELINEGFETAPSKRILKEIPEYNKVTAGSEVTGLIGV
ncbi:DUF4276 family protein [bacterium]|nr:DUF4276 family protein [bacterium]